MILAVAQQGVLTWQIEVLSTSIKVGTQPGCNDPPIKGCKIISRSNVGQSQCSGALSRPSELVSFIRLLYDSRLSISLAPSFNSTPPLVSWRLVAFQRTKIVLFNMATPPHCTIPRKVVPQRGPRLHRIPTLPRSNSWKAWSPIALRDYERSLYKFTWLESEPRHHAHHDEDLEQGCSSAGGERSYPSCDSTGDPDDRENLLEPLSEEHLPVSEGAHQDSCQKAVEADPNLVHELPFKCSYPS
jgi:hypothetical protein